MNTFGPISGLPIADDGRQTASTGVAAGVLGLSGAASGDVRVSGAATGSLAITGTATAFAGDLYALTASGVLGLAGSGQGSVRVSGAASGVLQFDGSAQGRIAAQGVASGSISLTGAAQGGKVAQRRIVRLGADASVFAETAGDTDAYALLSGGDFASTSIIGGAENSITLSETGLSSVTLTGGLDTYAAVTQSEA